MDKSCGWLRPLGFRTHRAFEVSCVDLPACAWLTTKTGSESSRGANTKSSFREVGYTIGLQGNPATPPEGGEHRTRPHGFPLVTSLAWLTKGAGCEITRPHQGRVPRDLLGFMGSSSKPSFLGRSVTVCTEVSKSSGVGSTPTFPAITSPHGNSVAGFWRCARPKTAPKAQRASTGD